MAWLWVVSIHSPHVFSYHSPQQTVTTYLRLRIASERVQQQIQRIVLLLPISPLILVPSGPQVHLPLRTRVQPPNV